MLTSTVVWLKYCQYCVNHYSINQLMLILTLWSEASSAYKIRYGVILISWNLFPIKQIQKSVNSDKLSDLDFAKFLTDYNPRYALLVISKFGCHRENQCQPRRSRGWHWFSRGDNFPCYPLMQSIIIIILLYWMLIQYIVYIKFGFTTIQVKWIFVFVSRTQSLKRHNSESMVNRTRINSAKSIFFGISPVVKQ